MYYKNQIYLGREHEEFLDRFSKRNNLSNRSCVVRFLLDEYMKNHKALDVNVLLKMQNDLHFDLERTNCDGKELIYYGGSIIIEALIRFLAGDLTFVCNTGSQSDAVSVGGCEVYERGQ